MIWYEISFDNRLICFPEKTLVYILGAFGKETWLKLGFIAVRGSWGVKIVPPNWTVQH
jgi:hypothetical protein